MDHETLYIRSRMVLAGRLAKIDVIDAAYMNRADPASGEADAEFSARMGFTGKTALSAEQIAGIHRAFVPTAKSWPGPERCSPRPWRRTRRSGWLTTIRSTIRHPSGPCSDRPRRLIDRGRGGPFRAVCPARHRAPGSEL